MRKVLWGLQAAGLLIVFSPFSLLPAGAGELLGLLLYHAWGSRRRIAIDNLTKSAVLNGLALTQSPEEVIKENFRNLGRFFVEMVKIYYGRGNRIVKETVIKGMENFERARAKGKGVIFVTGHCGNWELMAIASSFKGFPLSVVARPLDNPYLNKILERTRARFGGKVIYKRGALRGMLSTLKSCGYVGILMDQAVLPDEGYVVDFLGRGAWTTKAPSLIARKTEAPVLPAFIRRVGKGHEITIYPEVELSSHSDSEDALKADTQEFSNSIADYIRKNPSQWLWMHRRWKRVDSSAPGRLDMTAAKETI